MADIFWQEAVKAGQGAVITGAASGIGLAAAQHFAQGGMRVLMADRDGEKLTAAAQSLRDDTAATIETMMCDVAEPDQIEELAARAFDQFGTISVVMNNAGVAIMDAGKPWENASQWRKQIDVNLWGVIYGTQAFVPRMLEGGAAGVIINTASKQGITRPPGNSAYNLSKAGVIAFSEALAYELRQIADCRLSAHILIPGFTYTGMIARFVPERPPAAWTPEQVIDFMCQRLAAGDFYILCPDNDVDRLTDARRIQWHADDLIKNRPALSRWHPDYLAEFDAFVKKPE